MKLIKLTLMAWIVIVLFVNTLVVYAETTNDRMDWFRDAKFGMFIHFGASERGGGQNDDMTRTQRYEAAVRAFNPVDFDAMEWLRIAKEGGAKYIVFTTKHHDGFCKWDSALTDWDVMDQTRFKRDIVGELAEACRATGIRLGCYYSIADWRHPEYEPYFSNRNGFHYAPNPNAEITKYMKYMYGQIEELCVKYQPSLFWFDGSSGFRPPERKQIGHWLKKNGEAIYGTKAGPHPHGLNWGSITQRKVGENTRLYLNVVDWPGNGSFHLYGLDNKILSASLLVSGAPLGHSSIFDAAAGLRRHTITAPKAAPDPYVSVITVPLRGEGIMPGRMLSVGGFNQVGQALSWDFRLVEPGTYEVAVVSIGNPNQASRMRATVAGQSVENSLHVRERTKSIELPSRIQESLSVLGTVTIAAPGMQTLTLEVASDFAGSAPSIRGLKLLPVAGVK